nr:MAG TPA: hypothetical protein [Bacteriophage sp.]
MKHIPYPRIAPLYQLKQLTAYKKAMNIGEYSDPVFEVLKDKKWECTEKIDGCNLDITFESNDFEIGTRDGGKIPEELKNNIQRLLPTDLISKRFPGIRFYGEYYGEGILPWGERYDRFKQKFILFDALYEGSWINRDELETTVKDLGVDIVPLVGYMTLSEAENYTRNGFRSFIAEDKTFNAEGLVLKTYHGDNRVICKIRTIDFEKNKTT